MVEENNAASALLMTEGQRLRELVGMFKLQDAGRMDEPEYAGKTQPSKRANAA